MSETQDVIEVMARGMWPRAWVEGAELPQSQREYMRYASLALSALASAGYRLAGPGECVVPEEPTNEMLEAGWNAGFAERYNATEAPMMGSIWDAMLSASQQKEKA